MRLYDRSNLPPHEDYDSSRVEDWPPLPMVKNQSIKVSAPAVGSIQSAAVPALNPVPLVSLVSLSDPQQAVDALSEEPERFDNGDR